MTAFELLLHIVAITARREDADLQASRKSIFRAPERGIVYLVAKALATAAPSLFGCHDVEWETEVDLGNGGPSDLIIKPPGAKSFVVEFKMDVHEDALLDDIEKLRRLDPILWSRIFVALLGVYESELPEPPRVRRVESALGGKHGRLASAFPSFPTMSRSGKTPVHCVVCGWEIA